MGCRKNLENCINRQQNVTKCYSREEKLQSSIIPCSDMRQSTLLHDLPLDHGWTWVDFRMNEILDAGCHQGFDWYLIDSYSWLYLWSKLIVEHYFLCSCHIQPFDMNGSNVGWTHVTSLASYTRLLSEGGIRGMLKVSRWSFWPLVSL